MRRLGAYTQMSMVVRSLVLGLLAWGAACGCSSESGGDSSAHGGSASGGSATAGTASGGSQSGGSQAGGTAGSAHGGSAAGGSSGGVAAGGSGGTGHGGLAGSSGSGGAELAGAGGTEGGAGPGDDQLIADCLDAPVIDDVRTEALELEGNGVSVAIVRRVDPDAFGTSGTTVWLAERFGLVHDATAACVSASQDLDYTVSHHNFDDSMTANNAGLTWVFTQTRQDYDTPTQWTVSAKQGNTVAWGPIVLTLLSCKRLDMAQDCAAMYQ